MSSKNTNKNVIVAVVIVLVVAAAGFAIWKWRPANDANHPDGTFWLCTNNACKHEFNLSVKAYSDYQKEHYGEPVKCPKCQAEAAAADKCPHCGRLLPKGQRGEKTCPHCQKKFT